MSQAGDEVLGQGKFLRLVRQNGKTAVFVTHLINEALEVGDRVLVFHRPARIALEVRHSGPEPAGERAREQILKVLAMENSTS